MNHIKDLRASLPNLFAPHNVFKEMDEKENNENENKSFTERINDNLMKYKEIKMVYKKTGIPPAYLLYALIACLLLILIGYCEAYLTILIGTLYPIYISIKTLQKENIEKDDRIQWLTYW